MGSGLHFAPVCVYTDYWHWIVPPHTSLKRLGFQTYGFVFAHCLEKAICELPWGVVGDSAMPHRTLSAKTAPSEEAEMHSFCSRFRVKLMLLFLCLGQNYSSPLSCRTLLK